MKNAPQQLIIGMNYLSKADVVVLDMKTRTLLLDKGTEVYNIPISLSSATTQKTETNYPKAQMVHTVTIPPLSVMQINLKVSQKEAQEGTEWIFKSHDNMDEVKVPEAAIRIRENQQFSILLHNNTRAPVKVYKDKVMGKIYPLLDKESDVSTTVYHLHEPTKRKEEITTNQQEKLSRTVKLTKEVFLEKFDFSETTLNQKQLKELQEMLWENNDVFSIHQYDLGRTTVMEHKIEVVNKNQPIAVRPYKMAYSQMKVFDNFIQELEENDLIERCVSPHNNPCLLVRKADKTDLQNTNSFRKHQMPDWRAGGSQWPLTTLKYDTGGGTSKQLATAYPVCIEMWWLTMMKKGNRSNSICYIEAHQEMSTIAGIPLENCHL
uniref:Uncharacterized protein n=1 Tax=Plectus sambesii TaxID=2011161 RepID=A0A914ULX5_9BILA